jgi:hypothetical protein
MMQESMRQAAEYPLSQPVCRSCGGVLRVARTVPGTNGFVELKTFSCRECSLWITESADKGRGTFSSRS